MSESTATAFLKKVQRTGFMVGGAGLVLCLFGAIAKTNQFWQSYLLAWLFWVGMAAGCLALLMIQHLTGGSWGYLIRRILEAGTRTFGILAVLAVPLWFAIPKLYIWASPEVLLGDTVLAHKAPWLNVPFFVGRTALYLAVWAVLAYLLNKWSADQDRTGDPTLAGKMEALSGPGLALFGLVATFNAIDWAMSLEPHWFSTMYGLHFALGQTLSGLALAIVMVRLLSDYEPVSKVVRPAQFHDLGNLLLAFVMLWAYLTVSQFLIIWAGNLPEELPWYLHRTASGWQVIALALVVFHWVLLFRDVKRRAGRLAAIAAIMIFMRMLDTFWLIKPAFSAEGFSVSWMDPTWLIGLGGIWIGYFCFELGRRPLLPVNDPIGAQLAAARGHEHGMPELPEHA